MDNLFAFEIVNILEELSSRDTHVVQVLWTVSQSPCTALTAGKLPAVRAVQGTVKQSTGGLQLSLWSVCMLFRIPPHNIDWHTVRVWWLPVGVSRKLVLLMVWLVSYPNIDWGWLHLQWIFGKLQGIVDWYNLWECLLFSIHRLLTACSTTPTHADGTVQGDRERVYLSWDEWKVSPYTE